MRKTRYHREIIRDYVLHPWLWRVFDETERVLVLQNRVTMRLFVCKK